MDQEKQIVGKGYALVTGSGSGLGLAFAKDLASRGYPLIMVSLPGENLESIARSVSQAAGVDVRWLEKDLSQEYSCAEILTYIEKEQIMVTLLVNNAGIGSTNPFLGFEAPFYARQLRLNVITPVLLTRMLLPGMFACALPCYVLNVGSLGGYFHLPNKEVYGASKAFVHSFTSSLQLLTRGTNVSLMTVSPGPVETNERIQAAHKNMKGLAKEAVMLPEEVATQALDALFRGKHRFVPGRINRLFLWLDWVIPTSIKNRILLKEMKRQASFTR